MAKLGVLVRMFSHRELTGNFLPKKKPNECILDLYNKLLVLNYQIICTIKFLLNKE